MRTLISFVALLGFAAAASAQRPASSFDPGDSLQAWQDPGLEEALAECENPPEPFSLGGGDDGNGDESEASEPPPAPDVPQTTAIPGVIAAGESWETVWSWEGNNADGIIAGENGTMLFANNDASNVMRLYPETGRAEIIHDDVNTGGALSRSENGTLYLASRGLDSAILELEPERRVFADSYQGDPLDCVGGVLNDLMADSRGGVYVTITGVGVFYADSQGEMTQYGEGIEGANGIVLSPDETTLYVTNGPVVLAFDVQSDGALTNQREFAELQGGPSGDGSAVDSQGRLYVSTQSSVDVFSPAGEFLGTIPGPEGLHGTAFGGPEKRTLYAIVFEGAWGTQSARNRVIAIPTIAQGYTGRAK